MGLRVVMVFEGEVEPTAGLVAARLAQLGVSLRVVCGPRSVELFDATGATVTPLQVGTGVASLSALRRLLRDGVAEVDAGDGPEGDSDLVHAHGLRAGLAATLARPGGLPLVLSWSEPVPTAGVSALVARAVTRTVVPAAAAVLAATPELVAAATELGVGEALLTPPTLPDPPVLTRPAEEVREELALGTEGPIVLAQARLLDETRLDVLVDASAQWRREGVAARVVLVGVGPAYRELVARATVSRAPVTFAGERSADPTRTPDERASLEELLAASTVAVVTDPRARPEFALRAARAGVPLVVPQTGLVAQLLGGEALATGLEPRAGEQRARLGSGSGVATVPAGDVEALGSAVRTLLDEAPARADLAASARARIADWPDPSRAARELLAVYERVSRATITGTPDTPGARR